MNDHTRRGSASTERGDRETRRKDICGICNKITAKKDKAVCCNLCEAWYHASCVDIDDSLYEAVRKDRSNKTSQMIHFYCPKPCNNLASKFLLSMAKLENRVDLLTDEVSTISTKMTKLEEGELPPKMVEAVKQIALPLVPAAAAATADTDATTLGNIVEAKTKEQMAEMEDRVRRKTNLLVFRLEEDTSDKTRGRKKDEEEIQKLLGDIKGPHQPVDIRRLGALSKGDNNTDKKIRPLRLAFSSETARDETLKAFHQAKKQAEQSDNKELMMSKITVRKDLTPQERKEDEILYQQMKQKREESKNLGDLNAHWIRRRGQVVNVGKYPQGPDHLDKREGK